MLFSAWGRDTLPKLIHKQVLFVIGVFERQH